MVPPGLQRAGLLGGVHDGHADPVLDAVGGVVELQLDRHRGVQALGQPVQPDQRGAADQLGDVVINPCHGMSSIRWSVLEKPCEPAADTAAGARSSLSSCMRG